MPPWNVPHLGHARLAVVVAMFVVGAIVVVVAVVASGTAVAVVVAAVAVVASGKSAGVDKVWFEHGINIYEVVDSMTDNIWD